MNNKIIPRDTTQINNKQQYHGYQEWYIPNGALWHRGNRKHNLLIGYCENNSQGDDGIGDVGTTVHFHIK